MKRIFFLSIVLASCILLFGCKKKKEEPVYVTDQDGNVYPTVVIGNQVWMTKNLNTTKYRNGDLIPRVIDDVGWDTLHTGAYCNYDLYIETYGRLYNWYAVNDSRGIAPLGWHVASWDEWNVLVNYMGGADVAGVKLKEAGSEHWATYNNSATNESGFTALPGGFRTMGGPFEYISDAGIWWCSTEENEQGAKAVSMWYNQGGVRLYSGGKKEWGYSVRCVKD